MKSKVVCIIELTLPIVAVQNKIKKDFSLIKIFILLHMYQMVNASRMSATPTGRLIRYATLVNLGRRVE